MATAYEDQYKTTTAGAEPRPDVFAVPTMTGTGTAKPEDRNSNYVYKDGQWYVNGKPFTPTSTKQKQMLASKGVTEKDTLRQNLIDQGYDPNKAEQLAAMLLANASNQPSIGTPHVGLATPGTAQAAQAAAPSQIGLVGLQDVMTSGVGIGPTDPTTREVEQDELVNYQLGLLLDENGPYVQRAKQRAIELANQRGQLGSSFAAGAAHRAAIDAAMPIATADAQAYRDAAAQNMNALNEFALANLQRATQLELGVLDANTRTKMANLDAEVRTTLSNLDAMTQTNIANLDAQTRTSLANLQSQTQLAVQKMQSELSLTMQSREMTHQTGLEQLMQTGRVELAKLDINARIRLQEAGFVHDFNMNNLDHEQALQVNEILQTYQLDRDNQDRRAKRQSEHANLAMQAQMNYINYITAYANTDMDSNAAKRLQADAWNNLLAEFDMINGLYSEFDPIVPKRS